MTSSFEIVSSEYLILSKIVPEKSILSCKTTVIFFLKSDLLILLISIPSKVIVPLSIS